MDIFHLHIYFKNAWFPATEKKQWKAFTFQLGRFESMSELIQFFQIHSTRYFSIKVSNLWALICEKLVFEIDSLVEEKNRKY